MGVTRSLQSFGKDSFVESAVVHGDAPSKEQRSEGKKTGAWEFLTVKGAVHRREHYADDKLHGLFEDFDVNSNAGIGSGLYERDKRHGRWERFYPHCTPLDVEHFEHDLRHGAFKGFYENGQEKAVGAFKSDKKDGQWQ